MALTQHLTKDQFLLAGWATLLLSAIVFSLHAFHQSTILPFLFSILV
jgi:hypothetical protein